MFGVVERTIDARGASLACPDENENAIETIRPYQSVLCCLADNLKRAEHKT